MNALRIISNDITSGFPCLRNPPDSFNSTFVSFHYPIFFNSSIGAMNGSDYGGLKIKLMIVSFPAVTAPFKLSHTKYLSSFYFLNWYYILQVIELQNL